MTLQDLIASRGGQAAFARELRVDKGYLNRAVKSGRLGPALAVRVYRATGCKLGPLEDATPKQIEAIERLSLRSAA